MKKRRHYLCSLLLISTKTPVKLSKARVQTKIYLNGIDRVLVMVNGRKLSRAEGIGSWGRPRTKQSLSSLHRSSYSVR